MLLGNEGRTCTCASTRMFLRLLPFCIIAVIWNAEYFVLELGTTRYSVEIQGDHPARKRSCSFRWGLWDCRECDEQGRSCTRLVRKHQCRPPVWFPNYPLVKAHSNGDRTIALGKGIHDITRLQPGCTVLSCWKWRERCRDPNNNATKFTIYTNGTKNQNILDYAVRNSRVPMEKVQDHRKACLVVVFKSTYETYEDLTASDHWRYTTKPGQNHLFWLYSRFSYLPRVTSDHPFQLFDPGMAAVASDSLDKGYIRYGYDMALALPTPNLIRTTPQTVKKEYLLQFRGSVRIANSHPGYHHRWLAGEYWEESDTVKVDIECWYKHSLMKTMLGKEYTYPSSVYRDWTEKSIFGFAPGGSGPGSYRFVEILHAGGIPVVVDSFLPPLYPDIDWSRCLVTISPSQIVDLPRLLSLVRDEEIAERQRECDRLFHTVIGLKNTESDERVTFTRAMEIWEQRVHGVIEMNKIRD